MKQVYIFCCSVRTITTKRANFLVKGSQNVTAKGNLEFKISMNNIKSTTQNKEEVMGDFFCH